MSSNKNRLVKRVFSNGTLSCTKKKAIEVHQPIPKSKISINQNTKPTSSKASSSTTSNSGEPNDTVCSAEDDNLSITEVETTKNYSTPKQTLKNIVVIEKDSNDPYQDFKHSMLQMIFEYDIDCEDDLRDLLWRFLYHNDDFYHRVIVNVFNDVCHETISKKVCSINTLVITKPST